MIDYNIIVQLRKKFSSVRYYVPFRKSIMGFKPGSKETKFNEILNNEKIDDLINMKKVWRSYETNDFDFSDCNDNRND